MGSARELSGCEAVLLVEDELLVRMDAADVLEEAGYQVMEAANADIALQVLEADPHAFGVLVTDVHMPGSIDGCDLARIVHGRWPWIKIVVTSGEARLSSADIPDRGCFVAKPWPPEVMVKAIEATGGPG